MQDSDSAISEKTQLEREVQIMKLDLEEKDTQIRNLKNELERQKKQAADSVELRLRSEFESLFSDMATPVAQVLTQESLMNSNANIQVKDVMLLVQQMIKSLKSRGLEIQGAPNQSSSFDKNLHEALSMPDSGTLSEGESVIIKMVGISFQNKILRKAVVLPS